MWAPTLSRDPKDRNKKHDIPEANGRRICEWMCECRANLACESEIRVIRANRADAIKIGVWLANDSRELIRANRPDSRCESPVPLSLLFFFLSLFSILFMLVYYFSRLLSFSLFSILFMLVYYFSRLLSLFSFILFYSLLCSFILFYSLLFSFMLFYSLLFSFILFYSLLFSFIIFYSLLFSFILFNSRLFSFILFYSLLLSFILFYSLLFSFILFYSLLFSSILFYSLLFSSILFYSLLFLFYSLLFSSILFYSLLFSSILFYSLFRLKAAEKPLNSKKILEEKFWKTLKKCEMSGKDQKVWKSAETILPFGCCPLVFLWL